MVELMLAVMITSLVLGGIVATLNFWARGSISIANYADMSSGCRRAIDTFAYDVRMANGVSVCTGNTFTFNAFDSGSSTVVVSYTFDSGTNEFKRTYDGVTKVLLDDVDQFAFEYFDQNRNATSSIISVKMVQIGAVIQKQVLNINTTDEIISARFMLRNRRLSI